MIFSKRKHVKRILAQIPEAYLALDDFAEPAEFASEILRLSSDETLYTRRFLNWHMAFEGHPSNMDPSLGLCALCAKAANLSTEEKIYPNAVHWYHGLGDCL